jgi:hypothetical protein
MPDYRIYEVNKNGRIVEPPYIITCDNDEDATRKAKPFVDGHDVEVRQDARVVIRILSTAARSGRSKSMT